MDASERGRLLYKLADLIDRDRIYLAVRVYVVVNSVFKFILKVVITNRCYNILNLQNCLSPDV